MATNWAQSGRVITSKRSRWPAWTAAVVESREWFDNIERHVLGSTDVDFGNISISVEQEDWYYLEIGLCDFVVEHRASELLARAREGDALYLFAFLLYRSRIANSRLNPRAYALAKEVLAPYEIRDAASAQDFLDATDTSIFSQPTLSALAMYIDVQVRVTRNEKGPLREQSGQLRLLRSEYALCDRSALRYGAAGGTSDPGWATLVPGGLTRSAETLNWAATVASNCNTNGSIPVLLATPDRVISKAVSWALKANRAYFLWFSYSTKCVWLFMKVLKFMRRQVVRINAAT